MKGNKKNKKKDRAQFRCPDKVKEMIALVNSISPERLLPHRTQIYKETKSYTKAIAQTKRLLRGAPPDFIRKSGGIWGAYVSFRNLRRALRDLANLALVPEADREFYLWLQYRRVDDPDFEKDLADEDRARRQAINQRIETETERRGSLYDWGETTKEDIEPGMKSLNALSYRVDLTIGADGKIAADAWSQIEVLIGVWADRLRVCAVCHLIFWARQNNMWACSETCSETNKKRLQRGRRPQYEQARKKARKKKGRSAKAGTKRK